MSDTKKQNQDAFIEKVWITVGIVALSTIVLLVLKTTFSVLLLVFASILLSVFFRGLSGLIERKTGWNEKLCVGMSIVFTILILAGFIWLMGAKISSQVSELVETLPKTIEKAREVLQDSPLGTKALDAVSSQDSTSAVTKMAGGFFKTTFGVLGDIYAVAFIGLFLTVAPNLYVKGAVHLVPPSGQEKAMQVFEKLGRQLRKWLKGKLAEMLIVAVLTAIGLAIIGIPMWLVLALFAGLVSFIPNFGPIIALIPAVLVGLMQGADTALWVAGLYVFIQFVESNFITTTIQQKMVNLPPAMILFAQLIMGSLTGGWGLVLATPLSLVVIILVQELYIKERDGENQY